MTRGAREQLAGPIAEAPKPAPAPAPQLPLAAAHVLALQRSAGNAAVTAMLARTPARTIQRAPDVEFTPPPRRIPLGGTRLLGPSKPYQRDFVPEKRVQRPLAEGSFAVAGVPVGYELKTDAQLHSGLRIASAPVMLTDIELIARGAEAERLREGSWIPGMEPGGPLYVPNEPRGKLEASARLRFNAEIDLDASASATLSGGVTAGLNAFAAGAYGKLGGSAKAKAFLRGDNMVFLTWEDGALTLDDGPIPGFWLGFELDFKVQAEAGVYVELRVPEVPVVTSLYNEIESWPGVGWFLPDLKSLRWRREYGKHWELASKRYRYDMPLDVEVQGNSVEPAPATEHGPGPDAMLDDAGRKQKEQLKDDPEGPGEEKLKGDPGSLADARAAARAQLASTREIIDRERTVTSRLLAQARRTAAKTAHASTPGVQMAAIDPPGGAKSHDPVKQLEQREDALKDADAKDEQLEKGAAGMQAPAADEDGQTRNKARLGLEMVAKNADALGDKVNRGDGDLARPMETGNPADAPAMSQLNAAEPATLAVFDEASDAIRTEQERLKELPAPSNAPAGSAYKEAHNGYRKAIKKAADQRTTLNREIEAAQELRLSDPAGATTRMTALQARAEKLRDTAKALASLRPQAPPPASWFGFKAELNEAFRDRLRKFRGTDDPDPTHKGGEGAVFRDAGEQRVLKRWFADRLGDMGRSVALLKSTRAAVARDPVLSRYVRVIAIHDEGPDWILRDWVTAKQTVAQAPGSQDAVNAVVEAIGRLDVGGALPEELRLLRSRIRDRSENLRWDGSQIVVVDMM